MASTTESTTAVDKASLCNQSMDELRKVFDQFDANKDGRISLPELGSILQAMGSSYSDAELRRVMADIDTDSDGFISLEEFASLCKSSSSTETSSELKDAFNLYDQDKNGLISSGELHLVLNRIGMTCSVDDCVKMIVSVDSDGDGNVNFEEFQKMMSENLANGSNASA